MRELHIPGCNGVRIEVFVDGAALGQAAAAAAAGALSAAIRERLIQPS